MAQEKPEAASMENVAMEDIIPVSEAPKQRFLVGDEVEVRMLEKGLRGSWHPAKVVEVHKGKRLVEYEELLDEDEITRLKEFVPVGRASDGDNLMGTLPLRSPPKKSRPVLRPRPPVYPDSQPISWQEGVWVDCFYDDAWWEGVLAENITTLNVEDVSMITRKSEVDVLFPEENDLSKVNVSQMRIGQEWDEETGNWSLKGCVQVPVVRPNKKRSKKDSLPKSPRSPKSETSSGKQQATEVVGTPKTEIEATETKNLAEPKVEDDKIEPELCDNTLALNWVSSVIKDVVDDTDHLVGGSVPAAYNTTGYGYEERLNMFRNGGGSSTPPLNASAQVTQEAGKESPAIKEELPLENEVVGNATDDDPMAVETEDVQSFPSEQKGKTADAQNEEAVQTVLKHAGWKVSKSVRRKTGELTWTCKSPKVAGASVKTFSSLVEALTFEAQRGASGGNVEETPSVTPGSLADRNDDGGNEASSSKDNATGEDEDENDDYAVHAREILKRSGWGVFNGLRTRSDGRTAWLYRSPEAGTQLSKWYNNWRLAIEDHVKQQSRLPKAEAYVANQKKRGGSGRNLSPAPIPKKANKLEDASVLISTKSEEVPNSLPMFSPEDYSDVDGDDKREVELVVSSGRKRTGVDLGQKFTHDNSAPPRNSYLETPFGSVSCFTQQDNAYVLQVNTQDFLKDQITVIVENWYIIIKTKYCKEEQLSNIPVRCSGSMAARVTLPKDVDRQKITADFKSPLLTLTLPKSLTVPVDTIEIKIR